MTRLITDHQVNECNESLRIEVLDEPGSGGACHRYLISGYTPQSIDPTCALAGGGETLIEFQDGPIQEVGTNGLTHEALLAIVIDRLRSFQAGPYACRENALALTKLEEAQHWLHHRTRARFSRGVEGTHSV